MTKTSEQTKVKVTDEIPAYTEVLSSVTIRYWTSSTGNRNSPLINKKIDLGKSYTRTKDDATHSIKYCNDGTLQHKATTPYGSGFHSTGYYYYCDETGQELYIGTLSLSSYQDIGKLYLSHEAVPAVYTWQ